MRDTNRYPITKQEIVNTLTRLMDQEEERIIRTMIVGDMTVLVLLKTLEIVEKSDAVRWS